MRIAINTRSILLKQRTGIGRYTYHLIDSLGKIDPDGQYILQAPKNILDFKRQLPDFSAYKNFESYVDYWRQGVGTTDIYHLPCPDVLGPYTGRLVVTIHDLIYKTYPQSHTPKTLELTEKYMGPMMAHADRVICTSQSTRRDLHTFFDLPQEKTCVVYSGVDHEAFYPLSAKDRLEAADYLKENFGITQPFILFVGTIEPRKNLTGLLESFAVLKAKKIFDGQLVIAGMKGWMADSIGGLIKKLGISNNVIFTGFMVDHQLRRLYNMTELFVFPSFYEGFGFPIVEAFCCGAAVITSNTSSCVEVGQSAALMIDPHSISLLTEAMEQVLTDHEFRWSLQQSGLKRAQEFSFEKTAQNTLAVYQQLLRDPACAHS